ncbi:MAG TPA: site-specific integrase [Mucilaginibacter sp.]|nr:site-specific integrase [Mucilaginibacter sp.]
MATVAIVLNTTKKLSNNEYSVSIRATHNRDKRYYALSNLVVNQNLRFRTTIEHWRPPAKEDDGLGRFRKTVEGYRELNAVIESKLNLAKEILSRYDAQSMPFAFDRFEQDLKHFQPLKQTTHNEVNAPKLQEQVQRFTLHDYYAEQIKVLDEQERTGLSGLFYENQRILDKFRPGVLLTDVNYRFLESFEYWLRNVRKNKDTSISVKMRNLQRVMNLAIEDKLIKQEDYPFGEKRYSVNRRLDHSTKKIAIRTDKIGRLKALEVDPGTGLHFAQQLFLFSYYCRGMNFIDMMFLKWTDLPDDTIHYVRRKTRGKFDIPINRHTSAILEYFKHNNTNVGGYVFPILDDRIHVTSKQKYTKKKSALKKVNYNLKLIAKMIGEPTLKLTTNVGRHSYATGLKRAGVDTSYITEALGHATQEQTQTYLDSFEEGTIERLEEGIFDI